MSFLGKFGNQLRVAFYVNSAFRFVLSLEKRKLAALFSGFRWDDPDRHGKAGSLRMKKGFGVLDFGLKTGNIVEERVHLIGFARAIFDL